MNKLHISNDLSLPIEAVTQTFAVLAKRGVGKSYLASVMAEEMLKAGQQIVAIDPTGAWHGLRSSADGKSPGFPIVVIGGEHGDIPLNEMAGEIIAQAIVENRFSAIIDLSLLRKGQVRRFLTPLLETLYRLNREPLHLFVDEADDIAPQKPFGDEAPLVGAMEDLVKRGRRKGIGCTLITQRPADLAKQVLTQCEILVAMRLVHPRDINAIKEWVNVHGDPTIAKSMIDSLPALPVGTAYFWSPGWLGEMQQVRIRRRETFDSSATPKVGEQAKKPKARASIDIAALGQQIADAAEKSKADDPKELRKRIAELERQGKERPAHATVQVEKTVEVPVLKDGQLSRIEKVIERGESISATIVAEIAEMRRLIAPAFTPRPSLDKHIPVKRQAVPVQKVKSEGDSTLTGPEQRILNSLASWADLGHQQPSNAQVAWMAGYSPTSSSYTNPRGALKSQGLVAYPSPDRLSLTSDGASVAMAEERSQSILDHVLSKLPGPESRILSGVAARHPGSLSNEEAATAAGYSASSSSYTNPRGSLKSKELITYPSSGYVCAAEWLFA